MGNDEGLIFWGMPGGTLVFCKDGQINEIERLEWTLPELIMG